MQIYIKLPAYVRAYVEHVYGSRCQGSATVAFHPCTRMFTIIRDGCILNRQRRFCGTISYSHRAVTETRRHKNHRAINSTPDVPRLDELPNLMTIVITRDYGFHDSDLWTLSSKAATALANELSWEFWRSLMTAISEMEYRAQIRGLVPTPRIDFIRNYIASFGLDPNDYDETIYRMYLRHLRRIKDYGSKSH